MRDRVAVPIAVSVALALALGSLLAGAAGAQVPDPEEVVSSVSGGLPLQASPSPEPTEDPEDGEEPPVGGGAELPEGAVAFDYLLDRKSWFWTKQIDQEVGAGPVAQRVRLPNPHRPDTLPISVEQGEPEKSSALYFSLADRGVVPGSTITQLVLVIEEGRPGPEFPSFNATEKLIQACKITNFWPPGEAELWETIPPFEEGACAEGTRQEGETPDQPTTWTFDLTALAAEWGTDPFANNGVMLVGVPGAGGPQDSWQINLKIPARDDVATPNNEYDDTQARTYVLLQFQPGAPADVGSTPVSPVGGSTGGGTTTLNGDPLGGSTAGGAGSGDAGAGTGFDSTAGGDAGGNQEQPPLIPLAGPRFPWYVWLLIPVALAASAAVRAALLEAAPGGRPDGVIAAIRRRGAELRGEAGPQGS